MSPDSTQDLWPKWMWVAVPVLVVVVVAGLWWAIFGGDSGTAATATPTPTMRPLGTQPTQAPTLRPTLPVLMPTATTPAQTLPSVPPPTQSAVMTPTAQPTPVGGLAIGGKATVSGSGGVLNMRDGAGTGYKIVASLREGAVVEILDGPKEANGYTWWQVRNDAGTVGWAAGDWLTSAN